MLSAMAVSGGTASAMNRGIFICAITVLSLAGVASIFMRAHGGNNIGEQIAIGDTANLLHPLTVFFLVLGCSFPYALSSMALQGAGRISDGVIVEAEAQLSRQPELLDPYTRQKPEYHRCVAVAQLKALQEMLPPVLTSTLVPFLIGTFFGVHALCGFLIGFTLSALPLILFSAAAGAASESTDAKVCMSHQYGTGTASSRAGAILATTSSAIGTQVEEFDESTRKAAATCAAVGHPVKVTNVHNSSYTHVITYMHTHPYWIVLP
jgi:K(+)-stimulated pyrophosphate-energized sodium pump